MPIAELMIAAGVVAAVFFYRSARRAKYPHRLMEVESALKMHAEVFQLRNPTAPNELARLADQFVQAQHMLNDSPATVRRDWPAISSAILALTSEAMLTRLGLYYSDKREDIRAALSDLIIRLDKRAQIGVTTATSEKPDLPMSRRDLELVRAFADRIGSAARSKGFAQTVMSYPEIVTIGFGIHGAEGGKILLGTLAVSCGKGGERRCSVRVASGDTPAAWGDFFLDPTTALKTTEPHFLRLAQSGEGGVPIPA